jgi:integrase
MDHQFIKKKVSNTTYNNLLKMGKVLFNWATERCYTKQNAFDKIKSKRKDEKKRTIIPYDVRCKITQYLQNENHTAIEIVINLVYSSLIRPNEIKQLKIADVHLDEKYITVSSDIAKNHKQRYSALSNHSIELLKKYIGNTKNKDYYLFGQGKNNYDEVRPSAIMTGDRRFGKEWDKIKKRMKLPAEMQLYSFRDTGIWEMLKSGIDNLTVMQHADHSDLSITTRYAKHTDPNLIRKINENVPDF